MTLTSFSSSFFLSRYSILSYIPIVCSDFSIPKVAVKKAASKAHNYYPNDLIAIKLVNYQLPAPTHCNYKSQSLPLKLARPATTEEATPTYYTLQLNSTQHLQNGKYQQLSYQLQDWDWIGRSLELEKVWQVQPGSGSRSRRQGDWNSTLQLWTSSYESLSLLVVGILYW